MRIIAGTAGRMRIRVPGGEVRPTTDFVRQALFSILGERVKEARVLDLFAGSGSLGLEALSRGARSCVFVDEHRDAVKTIGDNLRATGLTGGRVVRADVFRFLAGERGEHELVLADPPYARSAGGVDLGAALLASADLPRVVADGGLLVVEVAAEQCVPGGGAWSLLDRRTYGGSAILLYERRRGS